MSNAVSSENALHLTLLHSQSTSRAEDVEPAHRRRSTVESHDHQQGNPTHRSRLDRTHRKRKDQVSDVSRRLGRGDTGDNHLGKRRGEPEEGLDEQEHQGSALGDGTGRLSVAVQADAERGSSEHQ